MKYLAILAVCLFACNGVGAPEQIDYVGHYIGLDVNDIALEELNVDVQLWFYDDLTCRSEFLLPDAPIPVVDRCEFTEPDSTGSTVLSFYYAIQMRGTFTAGGQEFTMRARREDGELNFWHFIKVVDH
jgi:hypothetical protein